MSHPFGYHSSSYPHAYEQPPYQQPGHADPGYPGAGYADPGYADPGYPRAGQPPAGYPQPAFHQPVPPPRRRSGLMIAVVAIAAVVVLCVGGVGVLFAIGVFVGDGARSPKAAVHTYLEAARTRDWDTAEDVVCASRRSDVQNLVRFTGQTSGASWTIMSDQAISDDRHEVLVRVTLVVDNFGARAETSLDVTFEVVDESGWKVCNATGRPVS